MFYPLVNFTCVFQRREFLQGALSQLSGPTPTQRMQIMVKELSEYLDKQEREAGSDRLNEDDVTEEFYEKLEEITEWCEEIDIACGKFVFLLAYLNVLMLHCYATVSSIAVLR